MRKDLQTSDGFLGKRKLVKKKWPLRERKRVLKKEIKREKKNQALKSIFGVPYKSTNVLSLNVNKIKKNI